MLTAKKKGKHIKKFCETKQCTKFINMLNGCKYRNEDIASNIESNNETQWVTYKSW